MFDITPRQLRDDLKKVRDARAARLNLADTEAIRAELVEALRTVQRLAALHLTCPECRGAGYHSDIRCEDCKGTGARLECSPQWARVIQTGVEQVRKLAGIEAAPESVVQVVIETASPLALLDQVRAGVRAIESAGILTVPVED